MLLVNLMTPGFGQGQAAQSLVLCVVFFSCGPLLSFSAFCFGLITPIGIFKLISTH